MLVLPFLLTMFMLAETAMAEGKASDVTFGGELRLRAEGFENILDLQDRGDSVPTIPGGDTTWTRRNDGYEYFRFRTRLWWRVRPHQGVEMCFRLGNEYRFGRGEHVAGVKDPESKVSLDNAWARLSRGPLSFSFGRMDLMYGEGFLVFDGTPADGSSSAWFDALKLTLSRPHGAVDVLYAQIDEEGFGSQDRDEDLVGVYATRGWMEAYALRRTKLQDTKSLSGTVHPRGSTTAVGARVVRPVAKTLTITAEGALQRGHTRYIDREGLGGYARLTWRGEGRGKPVVELGGLSLSGDDPSTEEDEGWDGFYGEWPKYSELLVYTLYDNTTRITPNEPGTWTNLTACWLDLAGGPPSARASLRLMPLWAPQPVGPGGGRHRGVLVAARLGGELGRGVSAHVLGEWFDPGDFYAADADRAWYARWQLTAAF